MDITHPLVRESALINETYSGFSVMRIRSPVAVPARKENEYLSKRSGRLEISLPGDSKTIFLSYLLLGDKS